MCFSNIIYGSLRVTLVVAFGFLRQWGLQMMGLLENGWGQSYVVRTLNPYSLFKTIRTFALSGDVDA